MSQIGRSGIMMESEDPMRAGSMLVSSTGFDLSRQSFIGSNNTQTQEKTVTADSVTQMLQENPDIQSWGE